YGLTALFTFFDVPEPPGTLGGRDAAFRLQPSRLNVPEAVILYSSAALACEIVVAGCSGQNFHRQRVWGCPDTPILSVKRKRRRCADGGKRHYRLFSNGRKGATGGG